MTTIALYPETKQQNDWKKKYKLAKQKLHKSSIYSNIRLKIEISNLFEFNQFFTKQLASNGYCKIPIDYIILPDNIHQIIKSNTNTNIDTNFIPVKYIFERKSICTEEIMLNEFSLKMERIMGFIPGLEFIKLTQYVNEEFSSFVSSVNSIKLTNINVSLDDIIKNIINDMNIIYSYDYKKIIFFNDYLMAIFTDDYILFYQKLGSEKKNYHLIVGRKIYLKIPDITLVQIIKKEMVQIDTSQSDIIYRIAGYILSSNKKELFNYSINSKMEVMKNYSYVDKEKKIDMKLSSILYDIQGLEISKYIKSGCVFEEHYNYNNHFRYIISQYGDNDSIDGNNSSGLRYRGKKYSQSSIGGKNISKTICDGDKIVYNKEGDETLTNLLVEDPNNTLRTEMVVGWKVAKSDTGELRIVKLGIFPDATIVRPVDEEYFITGGKERCDKAIVMDIQLAIKDNEISVVPEETSVYSYIYSPNSSRFEYNVGGEVIPNSFDSNEDKGCANGIHYFRNRLDVFKAYID